VTLSDEYGLRLYQEGDARWLAQITLAAIRSVGARRYTAAQVEAWAARHPSPDRFEARAANGAHIQVAIAGIALPVAYALLEKDEVSSGQAPQSADAHLDMLYCHPDHTRKGLADALLAGAEDRAREWGCARLYTEASELARPAFERAGYTVEHRRDFTIESESGPVAIHNYAMEKRLG